jgi:hypothetical protein
LRIAVRSRNDLALIHVCQANDGLLQLAEDVSPRISAKCHVWTAPGWQGFSSRRSVGRCSHVFGLLMRHEPNRMAERLKLARPMVRRGAGLDADKAGGKLLKKG